MTDLPQGWVETTLGEVAGWGSGGTPKATTPEFYGGSIPWAVIGDLTDGRVVATSATITEEGLAASSAKLVAVGTVLVAMYGSIGKLGIAGIEMATNQAIAFVNPCRGVLPAYVFWYLRFQRSQLARAGKGATQQNISQTILKAWLIPLAPTTEQNRIVAAIEEQFSRLDAAEESLHRARRNLERMRSSTIVASTETAAARVDLGDVCSVTSGPAFKSEHFGSPSEGIRLLRGENIAPGSLRWRDVKTWPFEMQEGYEHLLVEETDLILAMDRPVISTGLKLAAVRPTDLPALLVQRVARIRPDERLSTGFLHLVLQRPEFIPHVLADQTGTQLPHITLKGIRSYRIPLPAVHEQRRMLNEAERRLSLIDAQAAAIDVALKRASSLRRAIFERAFTGTLVPQDPNDEPASVLLERIRAEQPPAKKRTQSTAST